MNLLPRHTQLLTILKHHKDGLTTPDIFKISQTMVGNEIPAKDGTSIVSKLLYNLRANSLITSFDAGSKKIYRLSPLGHEALKKSDDDFDMPHNDEAVELPPAPVLPKEVTTPQSGNEHNINDNESIVLYKDGFYSPVFDMIESFNKIVRF